MHGYHVRVRLEGPLIALESERVRDTRSAQSESVKLHQTEDIYSSLSSSRQRARSRWTEIRIESKYRCVRCRESGAD